VSLKRLDQPSEIPWCHLDQAQLRISKAWVRVLDGSRAVAEHLPVWSRSTLISMSTKFYHDDPAMSRSRSWLATSSAASQVLREYGLSRFDLPTFFAVLTSILSRLCALVMSEPPDCSPTLRSSALITAPRCGTARNRRVPPPPAS